MADMSPLPNINLDPIEELLDFPEAIIVVTAGGKIHKKEWDNKEFYGLLKDARLTLHKPDGKFYDWVPSEGDLFGQDWIVI